MFSKQKQKKMELTDEQKDILTWVFSNYINEMPKIISLLLQGKGIRFPETYVATYKKMSEQQQNQVVLILSRYYNDAFNKGKQKQNKKPKKDSKQTKDIAQLISKYSYIE